MNKFANQYENDVTTLKIFLFVDYYQARMSHVDCLAIEYGAFVEASPTKEKVHEQTEIMMQLRSTAL